MKLGIVFFTGVTLAGCFLLLIGIAGSHGHLRFRPHMTEDWFIFGTPLVGIAGLIIVTIRGIQNRDR